MYHRMDILYIISDNNVSQIKMKKSHHRNMLCSTSLHTPSVLRNYSKFRCIYWPKLCNGNSQFTNRERNQQILRLNSREQRERGRERDDCCSSVLKFAFIVRIRILLAGKCFNLINEPISFDFVYVCSRIIFNCQQHQRLSAQMHQAVSMSATRFAYMHPEWQRIPTGSTK